MATKKSKKQTTAKSTTSASSNPVVQSSPWWVFLINGIVAILIGWMLLAAPVRSTITLITFLGLYWLISGIIEVVFSLFDIKQEGSHWGWRLFGGMIGIIAGLFVVNNNLYSSFIIPVFLMYIVAFTFVINGIVNMAVGRKSQEVGKYEWSWGSFFLGFLYFLIGINLLGAGVFYSTAVVFVTTALLAIVGGVLLIIFSFKVKD